MEKTKLDKTSLLILGFLAIVTLITILSIAAQGRSPVTTKGRAAAPTQAPKSQFLVSPTPVCYLQAMVPTITPTVTPTTTPSVTPTVTPTTTPSVTPPFTPTPTATPGHTITIEGRIYLDNDSQINGRGGVREDPIGPGAWTRNGGSNLDWSAYVACGAGGPLMIDLASWGEGRVMSYTKNVNYNPNLSDVCTHQQELERRTTGWINEPNRPPYAPHPSLYGGFSLTINPSEASVMNLGGVDYYLIRLEIPRAGSCRTGSNPPLVFGDWLITDTFWANTTPIVTPAHPTPGTTYEIADSPYYGQRCDYSWTHGADPGVITRGPMQCNLCFGGETGLRLDGAKTCDMPSGELTDEYCLLSDYAPAHFAGILVPVAGPSTRSLWIGVNKAEVVRTWPRSQKGSAPQQNTQINQSFFQRLLQTIGF